MDNYKNSAEFNSGLLFRGHMLFTCNPGMQPSGHAMQGHHELSLIQFGQGIPRIIYNELLEITEFPFSPGEKQIYLY